MINIVIPMAGNGQRFLEQGYLKPKPFIDIGGKTMIERVIDNLFIDESQLILVGRKEHLEREKKTVDEIQMKYSAKFIGIDKLTEGTACTVLFSHELINNDIPLLIANSDQIIDINIQSFLSDAFSRKLDGSILTFLNSDLDKKWSYAKISESGFVTEVKEKEAISKFATVGIYFFSKGREFVSSTIDMIINNDRVNNEFYTCPVYNYLISKEKRIGNYNILKEEMHGIGTPEDLEVYKAFMSLQ